MGICIGKKACRRQACKDRCRGWFGAQPDLERACKNACKADDQLIKDAFLCSGNWIDQAVVIAAYGYDPCPGTGLELEDYLDPLNDRAYEEQKRQDFQPVLIAGGALVAFALFVLLMIKKG